MTHMEIASIRHKALRRLAEDGIAKGLMEPQRVADMLQLLRFARSFGDLNMPPNYGLHPLTGDRTGSFAMTVTKNWRLTFAKVDERTVGELDLEDYH